MKDKVNSIDMNGKLDHEKIYNLFRTYSSKTNNQISEKIDVFKQNIDFFRFYSNKDIKNLFYIFELKFPENDDEYFSSFKTDIEQYIYCISQIILSIKLFLKIQNILKKIVINAENHLSTLKFKNKLENYNQVDLFLYLESLLKISEKDPKFNSNVSTILINDIPTFEDTPKNSLSLIFSNENKINSFSKIQIEPIIHENPLTPRFESESGEENFENQEAKNLESSIENNPPVNKESLLTLSKYVFVEKPFTPHNLESNLIMPQSENIDKIKKKRYIFSGNDMIIKNFKKNHYRNLLVMINKIYKKGIINSEEKLKLKQLIIEKSKKIEYFYYNIYKKSKNDKNKLITEVKKIVN